MDHFLYQNNQLMAEDVSVADIAKEYGTPLYIYSKATISRHWHAFNEALGAHPHIICYAVKANSNLSLLALFERLGSGFDVVSGGELKRVLHVNGAREKIVFSGVGKTHDEITLALKSRIACINIESVAELKRVEAISQSLGIKAPVSLRINPDIDAKTHPYISTGLKENKFGIAFDKARELYHQHAAFPNIAFIGIDCHIGSQLTELEPFILALRKQIRLADELNESGLAIKHLNLGGGLGVTYMDETPPEPKALALAVKNELENRPYELILEPGRAIMANAGILVTEVEYLKNHHQKHFAIVDAAMNDLLRPALYQAEQNIVEVSVNDHIEAQTYDIVGPVCESGDFLGKNRQLKITEGDLLAVRGSGAYGASMSSNYNSRMRAAEVLVDGNTIQLIRQRETFDDLIKNELLL